MCHVRWVLVLATFPTKAYPTNVNAEGRQHLKANSLRHRPWLVLISNCWHEQQACAFTAALNIEQPVESPGRNAEHPASQEFTATQRIRNLANTQTFVREPRFHFLWTSQDYSGGPPEGVLLVLRLRHLKIPGECVMCAGCWSLQRFQQKATLPMSMLKGGSS